MNLNLINKILSVVLFILIAFFIANTVEIAFLLNSHFSIDKITSNERQAIQVSPYVYGKTNPVNLGEIKKSDNPYFRLKLRFRVDDTTGYPNLFQTAPLNSGLRMEISGTTAALVMPDSNSPNGLRGMNLTTTLENSRWYVLEVEAISGGFVRASLDGVDVANSSGNSLNIDMSQLIVGAGFNNERVFKGVVEDITLIKGNLYLPHKSLMIVYLMIAFMIVLFVFFLWNMLNVYTDLQLLSIKLSFLALPLIFVIGYLEYTMSFLNTNYYTKRVSFEQQIKQTEILVLGSSNTFYGVAPEIFGRKGYNLSFPGNGMYFDSQLAEKFVDRMPRLREVVLTANYFTMGLDYSKFNQSWRQYALSQYFNIPVRKTLGLSFNWRYFLEPRNFSKIALHGKVFTGDLLSAPIDIIASPSGWYNSGTVSVDKSRNFGLKAANMHNSTSLEGNYDLNLKYWEDMVLMLQKKNIRVVLTILPTDKSYFDNLDKVKFNIMNEKLNSFALKHSIKFIDYSIDQRFTSSDFTWELPDHMNSKGAIKFSKILDVELIQPQLK